jgi:four helix bundle protein
MTKQKYDLEERLLEFSVRIIKIVEQLPNTRTGNHVAGQLLKSGTSPYPNHGEAQAAESPKDFIHKLRISSEVVSKPSIRFKVKADRGIQTQEYI